MFKRIWYNYFFPTISCLLLSFVVSGQQLLHTIDFAKKSSKYTFVTPSSNTALDGLQAFTIFHEADSLIRLIYKGNTLYKTLIYNVKIGIADSSNNTIGYEDFFSLRSNTIFSFTKGSSIVEYYLNNENNDIYFINTNIETSSVAKNRIVKLSKKEKVLYTKQIGETIYIMVYAINDNYIRTIALQNDQLKFDNKVKINKKDFGTKGESIISMGNSIGNTLQNTLVMDHSKEYPFLHNQNKFAAYIQDSVLIFGMENGTYATDFFYLNLLQQKIEYKKLETLITIPPGNLMFASRESAKTKNYFINSKSIRDGSNAYINIDVYDINKYEYLQTAILNNDFLETDSLVHFFWKSGKLISIEKSPLKENLKKFLNGNTSFTVKEERDTLKFQFQTVRSRMPAWKLFLSIATSITATYLINQIPNVYGYAITFFYSSNNVDEYFFTIHYDIKQKKFTTVNNDALINEQTKAIFKEVQLAKAQLSQFVTLEDNQSKLLGVVDNVNKQFKVFSIN